LAKKTEERMGSGCVVGGGKRRKTKEIRDKERGR
jgi:hypothetical protein